MTRQHERGELIVYARGSTACAPEIPTGAGPDNRRFARLKILWKMSCDIYFIQTGVM
jgi:hypothetical protein